MATDGKTKNVLENLLFYGTVCDVYPKRGTAKVVREDKNDKPTGELFVVQRGSSNAKDYWLPAVGDQVICVQMPNFSGSGVGDGFIIGTFFSSTDKPPAGADADTRVIDTPGNLKINVGGTLHITSVGGDIIINGVSLVNHVHGGVESGGSKTSKPQ